MQAIPRISSIILLISIGLLTGCAGVTRVPLDKNVSASLTRVDSNLLIPADELIVRAKPSNITAAMGGGLIPALIDASITSSRQTELEAIANPFYEQTDSLDFRTLFGNSFKASLAEQSTLPNLNISVSSRGLSKTTLEEIKSKLSPGEAYLGLRIWYEFTADTRTVIVAAGTQMAIGGKPDSVYKNTFFYTSKPMPGDNPLAAWSEDHAKAVADVFTESAKEIATMLREDLDAPPNEALFASLASNEKVKVTIPTFIPMVVNGYLVDQNEQRKIIRSESGELFSAPK